MPRIHRWVPIAWLSAAVFFVVAFVDQQRGRCHNSTQLIVTSPWVLPAAVVVGIAFGIAAWAPGKNRRAIFAGIAAFAVGGILLWFVGFFDAYQCMN